MSALFFLLPFVFFLQTRIPVAHQFYANDYEIIYVYLRDVIVFLFVVVAILKHWARIGEWVRQIRTIQWWVLTLIILSMVSTVFSYDPLLSMYRTGLLVLYSAFALVFAWYISEKRHDTKWITLWIVPFVVVLLLALVEIVSGHSLNIQIFGNWDFSVLTPGIARVVIAGKTLLRPYAIFPHPNVLGGVSAVFFVLFTAQYIYTEKHKNLMVLGGVITWILVLISFSRSAWIGLVCAMAFLAINNKKHRGLIGWMLGMLFVSLLVMLPYALTLSSNDPSIQERAELLERSVSIIHDNPLTGAGNGNFILALKEYRSVQHPLLLQPVHLVPVLITSELGVVAGVIFVGGLLYCLWKLIKRRNTVFGLPLVGIWIIISITSLADHYWWSLPTGFATFWLVMGLTFSVIQSE